MSQTLNQCQTQNDIKELFPQFYKLCSRIDLNEFEEHYCSVLEVIDEIGLKKQTKYYAGIFFFRYVCHSESFDFDELREVKYASIFAACSINKELSQINAFLDNTVQGKNILFTIQKSQIYKISEDMLKMNFSQKVIVTPYDLLRKLLYKVNVTSNETQIVEILIDFCTSLTKFCQFSPQQILWTCLKTGMKMKPNSKFLSNLNDQIPQQTYQTIQELSGWLYYEFLQNLQEQY